MAEFVDASKQVIEDLVSREWGMLIGREHRIVIQPIVAAFLAIRSGVRDARAGRPAYGWTVVTTTDSAHRRELIRKGCADVGRLFVAAVVIDLVYEIIVFRWIYPGQALIIAATLALPTYFLLRGLTNRLARWWLNSEETRHDA
jgi:hypothetical protein